MRVIVHMGMHKTGTSSIQQYFHATPVPGLSYLDGEAPNHSRQFVLLFADPGAIHRDRSFTEDGPEAVAALPALRDSLMAAMTAQLQALSGTDQALLISAEQISAPPYASGQVRLHAYLRGFTENLEVVGYVRSPLSYAVSAFQQRLRNPQPLRPDELCLPPWYRLRFEGMDALFGRHRVQLARFAPEALFGGDVVVDFARRINVELPGPPPARANESLSLEATALLYLHRVLGAGRLTGVVGALRINRDFDLTVRHIGTTRFTFAPSLWRPVLASRREDLEWMRARLDDPLEDPPPATEAQAVAGPEDLLEVADRQGPALEALLLERYPDIGPRLPSAGLEPRARVMAMLTLLRDIIQADHDARIARRAARAARAAQQGVALA